MRVLSFLQQGVSTMLWTPVFSMWVLALLVVRQWVIPAEDAVILYDYARSLASQGVISYGGSQVPIEGATDFLWMILIAGLSLLGMDQFSAALCLTGLSGAALLGGFRRRGAMVMVLFGLLATPYLYASMSGFSALFFSACFVLCIHLCLARHPATLAAVLLMCLVRPDGVVWGAGIVAWTGLRAWRDNSAQAWAYSLWWHLVLPGFCYFLWRAWYFSEWLPLPFLVKSAGQRDLLIFFKDSLRYVGYAALPLVILVLWRGRRRGLVGEAAILFLLPILFYAVMRLEQNIGNRFLAPLFFGGCYWIYCRSGGGSLAAFILLSVLPQLPLTAQTMVKLANSSSENVFSISKALSTTNGRMLITESGRLAYYSKWFAEDSWGLNTPRFAHEMISAEMVERGRYDLIVAHCDVSLLRPAADLSHDGKRSWENHCKEILTHLRNGRHVIYLAPFLSPGAFTDRIKLWMKPGQPLKKAPCERHDIYAIAREHPQREEVERVLLSHHAVAYNDKLPLGGGDLVCR